MEEREALPKGFWIDDTSDDIDLSSPDGSAKNLYPAKKLTDIKVAFWFYPKQPGDSSPRRQFSLDVLYTELAAESNQDGLPRSGRCASMGHFAIHGRFQVPLQRKLYRRA
jgi:hypothetical protein